MEIHKHAHQKTLGLLCPDQERITKFINTRHPSYFMTMDALLLNYEDFFSLQKGVPNLLIR